MSAVNLPAGAGTTYPFLGTTMTIKTSMPELTLIEQECPPGFGTPLHIHHHDDEAFYVLSGVIRVRHGDESWNADAGSFVSLPRGRPHAFAVTGDEPVRLLQLTWPGGFERFVLAVASLPPGPPDPVRLGEVAAEHGYEITGPPLDHSV
jgi:mannose-6-phosphate isomerase-like protein (cupin superfamily)